MNQPIRAADIRVVEVEREVHRAVLVTYFRVELPHPAGAAFSPRVGWWKSRKRAEMERNTLTAWLVDIGAARW